MKKLSIIIATYNRGPQLMRTLASLTRQTLEGSLWEVVVVNNNSADNTEELFDGFRREHPGLDVRMVKEVRQGVSYACNRGFDETSAPCIAIVDDDEEVNATFAEAYYDLFENHPDVLAAGGKITPLYEYRPPRWYSKWTERPIAGTLDLGPTVREIPAGTYPGGGNMAVRRVTLERYGRFDTSLGRTGGSLLGGEEKDFFVRLRSAGVKIWYVPQAEIFHIIPKERITKSYLRKVSRMVGISERVRTRNISGGAYLGRLAAEAVKWGGTAALAVSYTLILRPAKGWMLVVMRREITLGLLGAGPRK